jgi:hypothetical protein
MGDRSPYARLGNMKAVHLFPVLLLGCNTVTAYYEPEPETRERVAIEAVETVEPDSLLRVVATCPDDAPRLVFGGCNFGGLNGSVTPVANAPEIPRVDGEPAEPAEISAWVCTGYNTHTELPTQLTASAVCEAD